MDIKPDFLTYQTDGLVDHGEKCYLQQQAAIFRLGYLCVFDQVRLGVNPILNDLTESLGKKGVINGIDVVRLDRKSTERYADFTSRLWGNGRDVNSLPHSSFEPTMYDIIAGGHSRYAAALRREEIELEFNRSRMAGYRIELASIPGKIHLVNSPQDLISIQMDENIHQTTSQERIAIAVVESYFLGKEDGEWSTLSEYYDRFNGKFSEYQLRNAMSFARLPEKVREMIYAKNIPFSVGIKLGSYSKVLYKYFVHQLYSDKDFIQLSEEERIIIDETVASELIAKSTEIIEKRMNINTANKHIAAISEIKTKQITGDKSQALLSDIFEQTSIDDLKTTIRRNKIRIKRALDNIRADEFQKIFSLDDILSVYLDQEPQFLNRFLDGVRKIEEKVAV